MKEHKKAVKTKSSRNGGRKSDVNSLSIYLNEINQYPLLSREEEEATAIAAAKGNTAARNKLINSNLRFVVNVAKKFQGHGIPLSDLISEGNVGLLQAADRYDVDRGCRFISYAVWWIRQSILKALCEKSRLIRLPVNRAADLVRIEKVRKSLTGDKYGEPEVQEIAQTLGMDEDHVRNMLAISREILSLEKQVDSGKETTLLENFLEDSRYKAPDFNLMQEALAVDINNLLNIIGGREAEVLRCRFGIGKQRPMSLKEISDRYNLTKERIRQIEEKALIRLQHPNQKARLEAYVA